VPIGPEETLIAGSWIAMGNRMVADDNAKRIQALTQGELEKIAVSPDGWEILYRDPADGRYWEIFYPQSEMHGGGPESLRVVDSESL
jgi:hypothetical protein